MVNIDNTTSSHITFNSLPAILIGGPPKAGKSVLTYNLTQELRRCEIPHYVFRANPDIEGDWFLKGNLDTVVQIQLQGKGLSPLDRHIQSVRVPRSLAPLPSTHCGSWRPPQRDRYLHFPGLHTLHSTAQR